MTDDVYDQRSEYRNAYGFYYLTLWQQSVFGENKLLVTCNEVGGIGVMAYLQPPDLQLAGTASHDFRILIDGVTALPKNWDMIGTDERWAIAVLSFTEDQIDRLQDAQSVGARLYPEGSDWFYGFDYRLDDRSLRDMIDGCRRRGLDANPPDPMAVAGPETSPEPEPPTATTALGGMTVIPNRTFGVGVGERPALATAGFEECQAICLVNSDCQAVIFTPASGLCRPWDELGSYEKAIGSVSALRP